MVKNRCKDGRYYWVDAYVTPIYEGNRISGYQSVRCKPDPQLKRIASQTYQALLKAERGTSSRLPPSPVPACRCSRCCCSACWAGPPAVRARRPPC